MEVIKANPARFACGRWIDGDYAASRSWRIGALPVTEVARVLELELKIPVIDRTGLVGLFNMAFEYTVDANNPGAAISALQEQLGLKLVKTKGPRGFIVIDHIARPAPDRPWPISLTSARSYWYNLYHDKTY